MSRNTAFRQKVSKFVENCEKRPEQAARAIGLNLLRSVVQASPVDTGRFRGNWNVQFDAAPQVSDTKDTSGGSTISRGLDVLNRFKLGMGKIFILNHLPYSIRLEYGHSEQAPSPPGIVRLTVQRFNEFVGSAIATVKGAA